MGELKGLVGLYLLLPMFQLKPESGRGVPHHNAYMGKPCVPGITRVTLHEFDISVLLK